VVDFAARLDIAHHEVAALGATEAKVFRLRLFLHFAVLLLFDFLRLQSFVQLVFNLMHQMQYQSLMIGVSSIIIITKYKS